MIKRRSVIPISHASSVRMVTDKDKDKKSEEYKDKENVLLIDHDKENKTLFLRWADSYKESIGFKDYVLDLNKEGEVIGIEILNFDGNKEYNMEYLR